MPKYTIAKVRVDFSQLNQVRPNLDAVKEVIVKAIQNQKIFQIQTGTISYEKPEEVALLIRFRGIKHGVENIILKYDNAPNNQINVYSFFILLDSRRLSEHKFYPPILLDPNARYQAQTSSSVQTHSGKKEASDSDEDVAANSNSNSNIRRNTQVFDYDDPNQFVDLKFIDEPPQSINFDPNELARKIIKSKVTEISSLEEFHFISIKQINKVFNICRNSPDKNHDKSWTKKISEIRKLAKMRLLNEVNDLESYSERKELLEWATQKPLFNEHTNTLSWGKTKSVNFIESELKLLKEEHDKKAKEEGKDSNDSEMRSIRK